MKLKNYYDIFTSFMRLHPRKDQISNVMRYGWHYFFAGFPSRVLHKPLSVGTLVTYRCNLNCKDCFVNNAVNKMNYVDMDMTTSEFSRYISHPLIRPAFRISFSGGEPLLNNKLPEFIDITRREKKYSYLITNGTLLSERISDFTTIRPDIIRISLYKPHLESQIKGVQSLRNVGYTSGIFLSSFVNAQEYEFCEDAIKIAIDLKVDGLNIQGFDPPLGEKYHKDVSDKVFWDDNKAASNYFKGLYAKYKGRLRFSLPSLTPRNFPKRRLCNQLVTILFFDRQGMLSPCGCIFPCEKKYGSLNNSDNNAWNSPYMVDFRRNFVSDFPVHRACETCWWQARLRENRSDFIY